MTTETTATATTTPTKLMAMATMRHLLRPRVSTDCNGVCTRAFDAQTPESRMTSKPAQISLAD